MSLSAMMGIALSGMQAQQTRLSSTASNIANTSTVGYEKLNTSFSSTPEGGVEASVIASAADDPKTTSDIDMAHEMLALKEAEIAFKANAAVWETGADIWDLLQSIVRD